MKTVTVAALPAFTEWTLESFDLSMVAAAMGSTMSIDKHTSRCRALAVHR